MKETATKKTITVDEKVLRGGALTYHPYLTPINIFLSLLGRLSLSKK